MMLYSQLLPGQDPAPSGPREGSQSVRNGRRNAPPHPRFA